MAKEPIDFNSPLGISKREWTLVLGVNLALLLIVYVIAMACTLSGNEMFVINFKIDPLERAEAFLRDHGIYALFQIAFATVEETVICCYVYKKWPKWYLPVSYFGLCVAVNLIFMATLGYCPSFLNFVCGVSFAIGFAFVFYKPSDMKTQWWRLLLRLAIAFGVSFLLNGMISILKIKSYELWQTEISGTNSFILNAEYVLALTMSLGFLTILIPWEKGGSEQWETGANAGGSSPTSKRWSRKSSLRKNNNLTPKQRRRVAFLKAKVITIQTIALIVIATLPILVGKGAEFAILYVSFCLTRLILGFSHSLHFKSELSCITIGTLVFWGLTFLSPSPEASIIISVAYGVFLALGFRAYWELHDLMMYRKAAKTDRYAMLYTAFKANLDPRRIRAIMRIRGYVDESDIKMVQMYMAKDKVDYIAEWLNEPVRSVDRKLTQIAEDLYKRR